MSFGDGSDGDVTVSVNTTLTRDMNYNNLTIDSGVTLYPDGYVIYVCDTLIVNGTISRNGNNGIYEVGGLALPTKTVGGSGAGGGTTGPQQNLKVDGESVDGIAFSTGGSGRPRAPDPGGVGGVTENGYTVTNENVDDIINYAGNRLGGPGGGSAWDYVYSAGGGYGFGGGSGGGVIYIRANNIIINVTGHITTVGGDGGLFSFTGISSYAGGGGGGAVVLVSVTYTNNGTFDVSGGIGYNAGTDGTVYSIEYIPAPTVSTDGIPDTFTFGRAGKKRRHKMEV